MHSFLVQKKLTNRLNLKSYVTLKHLCHSVCHLWSLRRCVSSQFPVSSAVLNRLKCLTCYCWSLERQFTATSRGWNQSDFFLCRVRLSLTHVSVYTLSFLTFSLRPAGWLHSFSPLRSSGCHGNDKQGSRDTCTIEAVFDFCECVWEKRLLLVSCKRRRIDDIIKKQAFILMAE